MIVVTERGQRKEIVAEVRNVPNVSQEQIRKTINTNLKLPFVDRASCAVGDAPFEVIFSVL